MKSSLAFGTVLFCLSYAYIAVGLVNGLCLFIWLAGFSKPELRDWRWILCTMFIGAAVSGAKFLCFSETQIQVHGIWIMAQFIFIVSIGFCASAYVAQRHHLKDSWLTNSYRTRRCTRPPTACALVVVLLTRGVAISETAWL